MASIILFYNIRKYLCQQFTTRYLPIFKIICYWFSCSSFTMAEKPIQHCWTNDKILSRLYGMCFFLPCLRTNNRRNILTIMTAKITYKRTWYRKQRFCKIRIDIMNLRRYKYDKTISTFRTEITCSIVQPLKFFTYLCRCNIKLRKRFNKRFCFREKLLHFVYERCKMTCALFRFSN